MGRHLLPQPLGKGDRGIEYGARQNEKKLFAAVTANAVDFPSIFFQQPRDLLEHRISRLVAIVVVHGLELVDVAHDERERFMEPH